MDNKDPKVARLLRIVQDGELAVAKEINDVEDSISSVSNKVDVVENKLSNKIDDVVAIATEARDLANRPLPKVIHGTDYILTAKDKKDIAKSIEVPVVKQIVEKITTVEQPIITEVTKTVENPFVLEGTDIIDKINLLNTEPENQIDAKHIKNLPKPINYTGGAGVSVIKDLVAGTNITIDKTNPQYPKISSTGGGGGSSPVGGTNAIQVYGTSTTLNGNNAKASLDPSTGDTVLSAQNTGGTIGLRVGDQTGAFNAGTGNTALLLPDFSTSPWKYDSGVGTTLNKWVFYNNPGGAAYGIGMSANYGFGLFSGDNGYNFFSGATNVDGTGAFNTARLDLQGTYYLLGGLKVGSLLNGTLAAIDVYDSTSTGYDMANSTTGLWSMDVSGLLYLQSIWLAGSLKDSTNNIGTSGQVLSSTGTATQWITPSVANTPTTADLTGQTATVASVVTDTAPNDGVSHQYQIGAYLNVSSLLGTGISMSVSFTDENSNVRTISMYPEGFAGSNVNLAGFAIYPTVTVRAKQNTAITVLATVVGGTTITYDVGGSILKIN